MKKLISIVLVLVCCLVGCGQATTDPYELATSDKTVKKIHDKLSDKGIVDIDVVIPRGTEENGIYTTQVTLYDSDLAFDLEVKGNKVTIGDLYSIYGEGYYGLLNKSKTEHTPQWCAYNLYKETDIKEPCYVVGDVDDNRVRFKTLSGSIYEVDCSE